MNDRKAAKSYIHKLYLLLERILSTSTKARSRRSELDKYWAFSRHATQTIKLKRVHYRIQINKRKLDNSKITKVIRQFIFSAWKNFAEWLGGTRRSNNLSRIQQNQKVQQSPEDDRKEENGKRRDTSPVLHPRAERTQPTSRNEIFRNNHYHKLSKSCIINAFLARRKVARQSGELIRPFGEPLITALSLLGCWRLRFRSFSVYENRLPWDYVLCPGRSRRFGSRTFRGS